MTALLANDLVFSFIVVGAHELCDGVGFGKGEAWKGYDFGCCTDVGECVVVNGSLGNVPNVMCGGEVPGVHWGLAQCVEVECGELVQGVVVDERKVGEDIMTMFIHFLEKVGWGSWGIKICGWEWVVEMFDGHGGTWCEMGPKLVE